MPPPTDISVSEFARLLGTTAPTARDLLEAGALPFTSVEKNGRVFRFVDRNDAERYVAEHGPFEPRRGRRRDAAAAAPGLDQASAASGEGSGPSLTDLMAEVRVLREIVSRLEGTIDRVVAALRRDDNRGAASGSGGRPNGAAMSTPDDTDDDGRAGASPSDAARIVALEDVLRLQRVASALNAEVDESRAETMRLLLDALKATEATDAKRREVARTVEAIVGSLTTPGELGQ